MPHISEGPAIKPYWRTSDGRTIKLYHGDVIDVLSKLPPSSIQCCVTSPPYWGLRDYGNDKALEIGSEKTPAEFVEKMVEVFRGVKRVLRDDGTVWLNLGDTYGGGKVGRTDLGRAGQDGLHSGGRTPFKGNGRSPLPSGNLVGIPWRVALALQADG